MNFNLMHYIVAQGFELPRSAANAAAQSTWMALGDTFAILGAGLAVVLPVAGWIIYTKRRRRAGRHHHHHDRTEASAGLGSTSTPADNEEESAEHLHRHRRRRIRRRDHRPRNPTLAETGGLPPLRGADSTPPPPSL